MHFPQNWQRPDKNIAPQAFLLRHQQTIGIKNRQPRVAERPPLRLI
jgi:hypothetical protein